MTKLCRAVPTVLSLGVLVACLAMPRVASPQTRLVAEGRVLAADLRLGTLTLDHDAIQGLGPADTTDLRAQRPELLDGIRVGDTVRLTLEIAEGSHGLLTVVALESIPTERRPLRIGAGGEGGIGPGSASRDGERPRPWSLAGFTALTARWWLLPALAVILTAGVAGAVALGGAAWRLGRRQSAALADVEQTHDALRADLEEVTRAVEGIADTLRDKYLRDIRRRLDAVQAVRANGQKPNGPNGRGPGSPEPAPAHLVVLRRDAPLPGPVGDLVRALQERLGRAGLVRVIRDRRVADRRGAREAVDADRRRIDRRGAPPGTWTSLGLVLAPGENATATAEAQSTGIPGPATAALEQSPRPAGPRTPDRQPANSSDAQRAGGS
jgi:hypothetical protein